MVKVIEKRSRRLCLIDLIEANSMGHEPNLIDIYSASWGLFSYLLLIIVCL